MFHRLFDLRYQIHHMALSDEYGPAAGRPRDTDVTASFECRQAVPSPCTGGTSQQWTVRDADATTVSLVNGASGKCLDVPSSSRTSGTRLIQWPCNGGANQRWRRTAVQ